MYSPRLLGRSYHVDDHRLHGIAQLQVQVVGLPGTDILRPAGDKMQVGAKLSFPHFGIDFRHLHIVLLSFTFEARRETGHDTFHIVLVDLGFHLQFGRDHLADTFALGDGLADLGLQVS